MTMAYADHPDIPFVESRTIAGGPAYTVGRPDGPPIWIVVHDMEYPERDDAAEWTAAYFARGADGRSVSSHYTADRNSIIQCVRLKDTAWTVGNRPGNYRGINWELAGYASQTREQWLDDYDRAMLRRVAEIMRRDMAAYTIPARILTDEQVQARAAGVTSHAQLGRVFGGTDHTDPGSGFPWDYLIELLAGEDMTPGELLNTKLGESGPTVGVALQDSYRHITEVKTELAAQRLLLERIAARLDQPPTSGTTTVAEFTPAAIDQIRTVVDEELDEQSRAGADTDV